MKRIALALILTAGLVGQTANARSLPVTPEKQSLVSLDLRGSHKLLFYGGEYSVQVDIAGHAATNAKRLPLNLAIVIDRSGSMEAQGKITYAREAAKTFVRKLSADDRVSVVDYDDQVTVLVPSTKIGENRSAILAKIDSLTPRGSTNLSGGMVEGGAQVEKYLNDEGVNRVLLLSDGLANAGISTPVGVRELAEGLRKKGIQVSAFGMGAEFDEEMLTQIADAASGNYYFIENPEQTAALFDRERDALTTVIAKNVTLKIKLPERVKMEDVFGYPYKKSDGSYTVSLPDIYAGQKRMVSFKITPSIESASAVTVAEATLTYETPGDKEKKTIAKSLTAETTTNRDAFTQSADPSVVAQTMKAESSGRVQEAMKGFAAGDKDSAKRYLGEARQMLMNSYQAAPSPSLRGQIDDMKRMEAEMDQVAPGSAAGQNFIKAKKYEAREKQRNQ